MCAATRPARLLATNWLLLALLGSSLIAYVWPPEFAWSPFRLSTGSLRLLVAITMFCLGLVLQLEELAELRKHPWAVLLGVAVQCSLMPVLAYLSVVLLGLTGDLAQGVILVGCVPGAMASNVLTMTARGNVSYSISLTTIATLVSPLTVPLALAVTGSLARADSELSTAQLSAGEQSVVLLGTVVLPVVAGFALKVYFRALARPARALAPWAASFALLWIIASVVSGNRERLQQIQLALIIALLFINLLGYLGGWLAGRLAGLPAAMNRALSLEVGMQNAGLGTYLAALLFGSDSTAQIPTAAYTFGCMLTGTMLAQYWSHYIPATGRDLEPRAEEGLES